MSDTKALAALAAAAVSLLAAGAYTLSQIDTEKAAPAAGDTLAPDSPAPHTDRACSAGDAGAASLPARSAAAGDRDASSETGIPGGSGGPLFASTLYLAGPAYQPTEDRLLLLGIPVQDALGTPVGEVTTDPGFWANWSQYALTGSPGGSVREALGIDVDTDAELRRLWMDPEVQTLWQAHQLAYWQEANLTHAEGMSVDELRVSLSKYRAELRRAIWGKAGDVYLFLYELGQWEDDE